MGLLFGIRQILRVQEGGLCTLALPCNSFGFMSSSQHQRSTEEPWGNPHYAFVWQGNNLAARTALLWCLCISRSVLTLLENPARSRVADIPFFVQLMNLAEIWPQHIKWLLVLNLWYSLSELVQWFLIQQCQQYQLQVHGSLWWMVCQTPTGTWKCVLAPGFSGINSSYIYKILCCWGRGWNIFIAQCWKLIADRFGPGLKRKVAL